MSFTAQVREELAHAETGPACCRSAEAAAMVRLGGALHLSGEGLGWVVEVGEGAVARRLHTALHQLYGVRPEIEVHQPTALQRTRYRLALPRPAQPVLEQLGLLGADGRPVEVPVRAVTSAAHDAAAFIRGALMVTGSVSDPRKEAHLEIRVPGAASAELVRRLAKRCGATTATATQRAEGWRVVSKSGASIGALLARVGAHSSFLTWDGERLRRELRGDANRATNADEANLSRAASAAARQVAAIESAVASLGWDAFPDDLRETALARLANPQASLGELAALHDPPIGKATVHRRFARIETLAAAHDAQGAQAGR